ncbi:DUF5615 family PIN-like protein [Haliscomenobacter sp.]|uniref:DUF5615 family PIN-like protein n=1 Tax=Haliscomenobacter sp. TaxID=2717303 RepID=UPI003364DC94
MILADENLNFKFVQSLRDEDYPLTTIQDKQLQGISDHMVIQVAQQQGAVVLTEDKDFGELVYAHNLQDTTIIFLRYRKPELEITNKLLLQVVKEYYLKPGKRFITIARGFIRVNEL